MIEAMKQALEALEDFVDVIKYDNEQDDIGRRACCDVLSYNPHSESCKAIKSIASLRQAIAGLESQEPVAHCEAGPEFCQQCYKESLPTYGSEEVSKLREVIQSQAKIIADYEKQIDEPAIYPEEAYEMGLEAIAYYTHPPQRTWVGLTDEEENEYNYLGPDMHWVIQEIAAKLKEKNTWHGY
jgi:hypothetical protein